MTIDSESLFKTLRKNGLIDGQKIDRFKSAHPKKEFALADLYELVSEGYLTRWQAKRLVAGKSNFRIGEYRILEPLGEDELGVVYLARDEASNDFRLRLVSRELNSDQLDAYIERAYAFQESGKLPVVPVVRIFQIDGRFVIVSEMPDGKQLSERIARTALDKKVVERITLALTKVVNHYQNNKLIHGSIHDGTLLLDQDDQVLVDLPRELGWCAESDCEFASDVVALGWVACRLAQSNSVHPSDLDPGVTQKFLDIEGPRNPRKILLPQQGTDISEKDELDALIPGEKETTSEFGVKVTPAERKSTASKSTSSEPTAKKSTPKKFPSTKSDKIKGLRNPDKPNFENLIASKPDEKKNDGQVPPLPEKSPPDVETPKDDLAASPSPELKIQIDAVEAKSAPNRVHLKSSVLNPDKPDFDQLLATGTTEDKPGIPSVAELDGESSASSAPPVVLNEEASPEESEMVDEEIRTSTWVKTTSGILLTLIVVLACILILYWPPSQSDNSAQANLADQTFNGAAPGKTTKQSESKEKEAVKNNDDKKKVAVDGDFKSVPEQKAPSPGFKSNLKKKPTKTESKKVKPAGKDAPKSDSDLLGKPKSSEPKKDEPKKDEPKKDEPKKDEPKKDEPKKDEPKKDGALILIGKKETKKESETPSKNQPQAKIPNPFSGLPRIAGLPAINEAKIARKEPQRLLTIKLPKNMPLSVTLKGGHAASDSKTQFDLRKSNSEDRTWIVRAGPEGELKDVAKLFMRGDQLLFLWTRLATEYVNLTDLQNCGLLLKAASFQQNVMLRRPVVAPALNFEKSLNASTQIKIEDLPDLSNVYIVLVYDGKSFPAHTFKDGKNRLTGRSDSITANFKIAHIEMLRLDISSRVTGSGISIRAMCSYVSPFQKVEKLTSMKRLEESAKRLVEQADRTIKGFADYVAAAPKDNKARANYMNTKTFKDLAVLAENAKSHKKHVGQALTVARKLDGKKLELRVYFQAEEMQVDLATADGKPFRSQKPQSAKKTSPKKQAPKNKPAKKK